MDTGLSNHCDGFNVFLVDAEVGAPNGDGDASLQGPKVRDDLDGKTQGGGMDVYRKQEPDLNRLAVR